MNKWLTALIVILVLYLVGASVALFVFKSDNGLGDKIVIVPVTGAIGTSSEGDLFNSGGVSSTTLVRDIKDLAKDSSVRGVIFEIDSPGGTAVASQEVADAIKELNKPNYAVIRDVGASGAYWIATATDKIIASPISITGSIGVIASYLDFSNLFDKYGVTYERLVAGDKKDIGSPYKQLTPEERIILQKKLDIIHEFFVHEVATNRNLSVDYVRNLSTGEFFLGQEAKDLGLIDVLGNRDTAIELMKIELNNTNLDVVEKEPAGGLINALIGRSSYAFGRGFAKELITVDTQNKLEINAWFYKNSEGFSKNFSK